jgi:hypothetical protein
MAINLLNQFLGACHEPRKPRSNRATCPMEQRQIVDCETAYNFFHFQHRLFQSIKSVGVDKINNLAIITGKT